MNTIKSKIRDWAELSECFAWIISIVSVTFGSALSWHEGYFQPKLFALTLLASVLMQCGSNLCNAYDGWVKGTDIVKGTSGDCDNPLMRGRISLFAVKIGYLLCFGSASTIGLYLSYRCGWPILVFGLLGLLGARSYTGGPLSYKEAGLGPILVFFLMGPMMILPSYFIQRGELHWWPALAGIPISLLISMVMQANDIRDREDDRKVGIKTLATRLGNRGAFAVYATMWILAYAVQGWAISAGYLPWSSAITVAIWPQLLRLARHYSSLNPTRADIVALEKLSAQMYMKYGLLTLISTIFFW